MSNGIFDVPLLLGLFSKAASDRNKNSSLFAKKSLLLTLSPTIVFRKSSNPLFKLFGNYNKPKKN